MSYVHSQQVLTFVCSFAVSCKSRKLFVMFCCSNEITCNQVGHMSLTAILLIVAALMVTI